MRFFLKILEGPVRDDQGRKLTLPIGKSVAGRSAPADILLAGSKVSKRHCLFSVTKEGAAVEDLRSANGLFVNGKKVSGAEIRDGDRLVIGDFTFEVTVE